MSKNKDNTVRTRGFLFAILAGALITVVLVLGAVYVLTLIPQAATVVNVYPGQDLDARANAAQAGDTIAVHGPYTYTIDDVIELKDGQTLTGDAGSETSVGTANVPHPTVGIKGASGAGLKQAIYAAPNATVSWLDIDASLTQKSVYGLSGDSTFTMDHDVVHGAPASGIGQYRGRVLNSELYGNGTNPSLFDGTVAGVKCNYACEVAHSYVHDNPGNGIWCDVGCQTEVGMPDGFSVHDNVVANNGRHGVFFENSPEPGTNWFDTSVHALITHNYVWGSGKSEVSCSDSLNCKVDANTLGVTRSGTISRSANGMGVEMHSSGEVTRGIQKDAVISNNALNGESVKGTGTDRNSTKNTGCGDNGNVCSGNF